MDKKYTVDFSEQELIMIYDVFSELTGKSLEKWTTLLPKKGEYRSSDCFQQWLMTGMFDDVRGKAARELGFEAPISDEEEDISRSAFDVYRKEMKKVNKQES